jgi:hypothetical protein
VQIRNKEARMPVSEGDAIVVEARSVNGPERAGTVARVLAESPPRYLVRWENGRESIISPAAGELRVVLKQGAKRPSKPRRTPKRA